MTEAEKKKMYKAVYAGVGKVLCEDWDPLVEKDDDNDCSGAYTIYIAGIAAMLFENRSKTMLAEELCFIEEDKMFITNFRQNRVLSNEIVADKLMHEFLLIIKNFGLA